MKQYHLYHPRITVLALALLPLAAWTQSLHTGRGIHLVVTGAPHIVLQDIALVNDGDYRTGNSSFIFTGNASSKTAFIGGSRPVAFYRFTINKAQGSLLLGNNISVSGLLSMEKGNLELNNRTIDLGATGSIAGERNESRITGVYGGTVKAIALLNAPQAANPGHLGVEISSPANLGLTTIIRGHVPQDNATVQTGIQRYFDILPAVNTGLHASLRFYYFDSELAGNDKDALNLFATRNGQHDWLLSGRDNTNGVAGWVVKNDISQLNRFTLAIAKSTPVADRLKATALAWPNPMRNTFTLSVSTGMEKEVIVSLYDPQGRLLEVKRLHCLTGSNQLPWDMSRYAAATYCLRFSDPAMKNIAVTKQ